MKTGYLAYNLTEAGRSELLRRYPAKFPKVLAHHITIAFGIPEPATLPDNPLIEVVGYAANEHIECVVVEVNGSSERESDGKLYHITLSHDAEAKPVDSNKLLADQGFTPIDRFFVAAVTKFNAF